MPRDAGVAEHGEAEPGVGVGWTRRQTRTSQGYSRREARPGRQSCVGPSGGGRGSSGGQEVVDGHAQRVGEDA